MVKMMRNTDSAGGINNGDTISIKSSSKVRKNAEIPPFEKRNWLIHLNFLRSDKERCLQLIEKQLNETHGTCEYALHLKGSFLRSEGKLQQSLEMFHTCTVLNSKSLANVKQVAKALFLLGKHKAAAEVYEESRKLNDKDWDILQGLGECYRCSGDFEKAKDCYREAFLVSKREESFLALAKLCLQQKDISLAAEVYNKAIDYFSDSYELHLELGLLYLDCGNQNKAFEHIGAALTLNPQSGKAFLAAGVIMQKNADPDAALSKYYQSAALCPDSGALWNNVGMCFFRKKKFVAAISCLKRALYLAPLEWKILFNLGLVHLIMQQYASAFHFLSASINLHPLQGRVFMLLAVTLNYLQDPENAKLAYLQAIELDRQDPLVCLNFAIFLFNAGDINESSQQLAGYERRLASYTQTEQWELDQEHFDVASRLGAALAG